MNKLEIIYEDNDLILCRKPAGIATQTRRLGQQDMESLLKNDRAEKGEPPYIGIVHRLDQPVEGIMVFAKNQKAAAGLSKQIQQRMIGKYYYAVSENRPKETEGILEDYLLTDKKSNVTQVVEQNLQEQSDLKGKTTKALPKDAKKAKLEYRVIETKENKTLFAIKLHTGRQHQIRVQMAHMGCPLVGDAKYGNPVENKTNPQKKEKKNGIIKKTGTENKLALCSYRLEFIHPVTGKTMDFRIVPQGNIFQNFFVDL